MVYTTSQRGIDLIKRWEGYRDAAYQDVRGIWTIGFGTTHDVHQGQTTTREQADKFLQRDLLDFEKSVNRLVTAPISQWEFDALVSFTYNLGAGALETSTLLRMLNAGDHIGAALEFQNWNKSIVKGVKQTVPGLLMRRWSEATVFLGA